MSPQFGIGQRPREQWPIIAPKGNRSQHFWIIGLFADWEFSLLPITLDRCGHFAWGETLPYSRLWEALAALPRTASKAWLIGNRVRYALEQASILKALENGQVSLPKSRKKDSKGKRSGKLSCSLNCLEIDLVCGKNPIKILDWKNYGFPPIDDTANCDMQAKVVAENQWRDYVELCEHTGMTLSKTTSAQMGWQHARINHAPPVLLYNLDDEARAMERRAYFGGRNEAYRLGDIADAVLSLDVKSSYASICATRDVPIFMEEDFPLGLPVEQIEAGVNDHWIADVVLSTPTPDYPLRHQGVNIYPTGTFCTALAWPELKHALERGRVEKVLRAARYRAGPAMKSFAKWYLKAREKLTQAGLNSIAGTLKAAFNGALGYTARQKYTLMPWQMDLDRAWWIGYTSAPDHSAPVVHAQVLNGVKEWLRIGGEPREAIPFLHATISSWARIRLLEIMEAAGREWIHYCDTDGILVDYRGYANLLDTPGMIGDKPGQLGERFKSGLCRIQGQKNYKIGDQVICSGMVRTRDSIWQNKRVLETPTGRINSEGVVTPFEFRCEDAGGELARWINVMI